MDNVQKVNNCIVESYIELFLLRPHSYSESYEYRRRLFRLKRVTTLI
jgi:hypothetical protein